MREPPYASRFLHLIKKRTKARAFVTMPVSQPKKPRLLLRLVFALKRALFVPLTALLQTTTIRQRDNKTTSQQLTS
jgi:hypothetical protein